MIKVRSKSTGDSGYIEYEDEQIVVKGITCLNEIIGRYNTLEALFNEWEDYEEPEIIWYINSSGGVCCAAKENYWGDSKLIGNYFDTREEAEKAVEKLKAWKRLKDKGCRFERCLIGGEYGNTITFSDYIECNEETRADLDLLFGGEE